MTLLLLPKIDQKQPPRWFFKKSVLFFQEQPFYNFPEGFICSLNRHVFFEQTQIFQESLSNRHLFSRRVYLFVKQTLLSHRTDTNFTRNPYLVLKHFTNFPIAFFIFSSNRYSFFKKLYLFLEHIIFQETLMPQTDRHFPGRYPSLNRYFVNRSRWLLSIDLST